MRRRIALAVLVSAMAATGTGVTGLVRASASVLPPQVPAACVTQAIGPAQLEVGYCPDGPS